MQPHADQTPCQSYASGMSLAAQLATVAGGYPVLCGRLIGASGPPSGAQEAARNITMSGLAQAMTGQCPAGFCGAGFGRPIIDKTGLTGGFDLKLNFTYDLPAGRQPGPDDVQAALVSALRDELGLKLEPSTATVDVFVVDHIEEPTAN